MGRKKRGTAKTGDVALYKARDELGQQENKKKNQEDNDAMYDEVDRYNNARNELQEDMLNFDKNDGGDSDEDMGAEDVENVFDLAVGDSDDDSDDSSSDSEGSDEEEGQSSDDEGAVESSSDDDDSSDEEELPETDVMNWGKKKKDYYHGDTADLEIGQEEEDAELEEEAGKEVLKARLEEMTEDDFNLDDDDEEEKEEPAKIERKEKKQKANKRSISQMSTKEKRRKLEKDHPELLPLISHFREEMIRPCAEETLIVSNALFQDDANAKAVGATSAGLQYLISKAMLQTSTALNVCQYLLLKGEQAKRASSNATRKVEMKEDDVDMIFDTQEEEENIKDHPVISRLNQMNALSSKLEDDVESNVEGLNIQMSSLVKASALMTGEAEEGGVDVDDDSDDGSTGEEDPEETSAMQDPIEAQVTDASSTSSSSEGEDEEEATALRRRVMTEARFSHRPQDDEDDVIALKKRSSKRERRRAPTKSFADFGDDDDKMNKEDIVAAGRSLASTVNTISQRHKSRKGKSGAAPEEETAAADEEKLRMGLEMMEAELGADSEDDFDGDGELDDGLDDDDDDDFYSKIKQKSKEKKEYKKNLYAVAPKYPGIDDEIDGERAVGNMIMKNRGLVAHKAKINRNPRVKKREQYRKALIRRKGAHREVRTDEAHKYGGEDTGIKSGLSRSRKLGGR